MTRRAGRSRQLAGRPHELGVGFPCVVCGRQIVVTADEHGVRLADRDRFLEDHGACLARLRLLDRPQS